MAGPFKPHELEEIHKKLKAKQDSLEPYLTIKMMMELLGYKSPYSVQNVLNRLIDLGLVEAVKWGEIKRYRILEREK